MINEIRQQFAAAPDCTRPSSSFAAPANALKFNVVRQMRHARQGEPLKMDSIRLRLRVDTQNHSENDYDDLVVHVHLEMQLRGRRRGRRRRRRKLHTHQTIPCSHFHFFISLAISAKLGLVYAVFMNLTLVMIVNCAFLGATV